MCVSPKHSLCVHVRLCFATEFLLITSITVQWVYHQRVPYPSTTSPPSFCDTWQAKSPQGKKTRFTGLRAGEVCVWRRYVVCMSLCVIYMNSFIQNRWREDDKHRKKRNPQKAQVENQAPTSWLIVFFHSLRIIQTTDQLSTMFMAIILPSTRLRTLKQEELHPGWNIHIQ